MIATLFEWSLLKDAAEIIAAISRMLLTNGLNYYVAFPLWYLRALGLTGILLCINEVVLLRYVTKVILKRIITMNNALIGTWITLSNICVALILTCIQTQTRGFRKNLQRLTNEILPKEGLAIGCHPLLFIIHVILALVIVLHVCINKFKNRNSTPVIQINIPNPQVPTINQPIALNNQTYNKDLFDFSTYFLVVLLNLSLFVPAYFVMLHESLSLILADYFRISLKDVIFIYSLVRNFLHAILSFVSPLVLMVLSDELRPFLVSCLSCSCCSNDEMIEVYN